MISENISIMNVFIAVIVLIVIVYLLWEYYWYLKNWRTRAIVKYFNKNKTFNNILFIHIGFTTGKELNHLGIIPYMDRAKKLIDTIKKKHDDYTHPTGNLFAHTHKRYMFTKLVLDDFDDVIAVDKNGRYISLVELIDNSKIYTNKKIRTSTNLPKLLESGNLEFQVFDVKKIYNTNKKRSK